MNTQSWLSGTSEIDICNSSLLSFHPFQHFTRSLFSSKVVSTHLWHTPLNLLPTAYEGIPFIVGLGDCLGCALRVCCNFLDFCLMSPNPHWCHPKITLRRIGVRGFSMHPWPFRRRRFGFCLHCCNKPFHTTCRITESLSKELSFRKRCCSKVSRFDRIATTGATWYRYIHMIYRWNAACRIYYVTCMYLYWLCFVQA